jgi:adenine-specific DNA-methyltransferase
MRFCEKYAPENAFRGELTGSKLNFLPYILPLVADLNVKTVLDGFSGSTRVSQAFAKMGLTTTANDISVWSETFATAYLRKRTTKFTASNIFQSH